MNGLHPPLPPRLWVQMGDQYSGSSAVKPGIYGLSCEFQDGQGFLQAETQRRKFPGKASDFWKPPWAYHWPGNMGTGAGVTQTAKTPQPLWWSGIVFRHTFLCGLRQLQEKGAGNSTKAYQWTVRYLQAAVWGQRDRAHIRRAFFGTVGRLWSRAERTERTCRRIAGRTFQSAGSHRKRRKVYESGS